LTAKVVITVFAVSLFRHGVKRILKKISSRDSEFY